MRKPCLGCVLKHLGSAAVLEEEIRNGYPSYKFLLYGHMDQAASEAWKANENLAKVIRQHRVNFQYRKDYDIPFEAIVEYVTAVENTDDPGVARIIEPTRACLVGIETDENGRPIYDGDTRP